jgi:class 3 adenylate cyclase
MDAPPIQYARTEDGVNIAYWTLGEGDPVFLLHSLGFSHLALEWEVPAMRSWYERMAEQRTVVRLNLRGGGLSDRDVPTLGLEEFSRDIDAVADATGFDRFAVTGCNVSGALAIYYAATRPSRVDRLVLFDASPDHSAGNPLLFWAASAAVRDLQPSAFAAMMLGQNNPVGDRDDKLAQLLQEVFESDRHPGVVESYRAMNVSQHLADVACPTLVLGHHDGGFGEPKPLAAGIPGAQLTYVDGASVLPYYQDADGAFSLIDGFLQKASAAETPRDGAATGSFRTILFTDVVASTPLLAQLKDAKMRDVMHDHDAVLDAAVTEHGGRVVKEIGDAFMVEFAIPSAAVECAIAIQRGIQAQFADSDVPIRLRIGINAGEPVAEDGDLHGASVNIAKRLESAAATNGILVSDVVKQAVVGKDFEFADQGEVALKGFDDPVHAWSVEWA